jgi:hypothetical protein
VSPYSRDLAYAAWLDALQPGDPVLIACHHHPRTATVTGRTLTSIAVEDSTGQTARFKCRSGIEQGQHSGPFLALADDPAVLDAIARWHAWDAWTHLMMHLGMLNATVRQAPALERTAARARDAIAQAQQLLDEARTKLGAPAPVTDTAAIYWDTTCSVLSRAIVDLTVQANQADARGHRRVATALRAAAATQRAQLAEAARARP